MSAAEPYVAIRVVMMPRDTNPLGSIFGGVILSYIDSAGAIGARREIALAGGALPFLAFIAGLIAIGIRAMLIMGGILRDAPKA